MCLSFEHGVKQILSDPDKENEFYIIDDWNNIHEVILTWNK